MSRFESKANCPVKPVTEKISREIARIDDFNGCLIITVTEKGSKLWSITLTGSEDLDQESKDAVFHQLALKYNWLETKKEKMEFLIQIEQVIFPRLSIMPRKCGFEN